MRVPVLGRHMSADAIDRAPLRIEIREDADVAVARIRARTLARGEGLEESSAEAFVTAVSELARNVLVHARAGEIQLSADSSGIRRGVAATVLDDGPGIEDVEQALEDGFSTSGGLGLGLSSARRQVDEFDIASQWGKGTIVRLRKWCR